MNPKRAGGILLHPTSLPSRFGIGDLGPQAHAWIEWLARSGSCLWQLLPLGPTGYGDSPYQSFSAFAGNPLLISPELLLEEGLLRPDELEPVTPPQEDRVDFGQVIVFKEKFLRTVADRWPERASASLQEDFQRFLSGEAAWLDDYALFMALKRRHDGLPWTAWDPELRNRRPRALAKAKEELAREVGEQHVRQFLFFRQWAALHEHARAARISLIGDVPIFVAHDSADVWSRPDLFHLDGEGNPTHVAGVPPDYFSPTGQRWGNPLYRWDQMKKEGYRWWGRRLRSVLSEVEIVRLDHFRGFQAYWEIPASAPTAETGRWVEGPGAHFLQAMREALGGLPLIAEDLGFITPEVTRLRTSFDLPGMRIIQFAFGGDPDHEFLPHNYPVHCVVYTGTHDNDTARGWYESAPEAARDFCRRYLGREGRDIAWDLIRLGWSSVAAWSLAPLQDLLSLGSEARMNYPSREQGNWGWRVAASQLTDELADRLREFNVVYGRSPTVPKAEGRAFA